MEHPCSACKLQRGAWLLQQKIHLYADPAAACRQVQILGEGQLSRYVF
jgi:hypothetical protein